MRRRLYFVLPDVDSGHRTANDLLLARVEDRHMRFLARRGTDLRGLHEAGYLDKTDAVHGAVLGLGVGGAIGVAAAALIVAFPPDGMQPALGALLIGALVGAVLGAWMASMAASAVPNSRLARFAAEIDAGKVLLMLDVPYDRVEEVIDLVQSRHPEAVPQGQAVRYVFP